MKQIVLVMDFIEGTDPKTIENISDQLVAYSGRVVGKWLPWGLVAYNVSVVDSEEQIVKEAEAAAAGFSIEARDRVAMMLRMMADELPYTSQKDPLMLAAKRVQEGNI